MQKLLFFCGLLCLQHFSSHAQLVIKGRIKCMNPTMASTKGAENIIVVPAFLPSKSTITVTRPTGYFEFNTGLDLSKLYEKEISLYLVSQCSSCKAGVRRVFVSEDQDRQFKTGTKSYMTVKDWNLEMNCKTVELAPFRADSILRVILKQPGADLDKTAASSALLGTPSFLNFITQLITVVGNFPPNSGIFPLQKLGSGKMPYGKFLFASPMSESANTGFNFSPSRDLSEAIFWNPSAIANSRNDNNISLLTNFRNNAKLSAFGRINDKLFLGVGGIYTRQDEFRKAEYDFDKKSDSAKVKLNEFAAYLSAAYKVGSRLSLGISVKSIWQNSVIPFNMKYLEDNKSVTFLNTTFKKQGFDVDLSATYKVSPSLQLGINAMNLAGSSLHTDAFFTGQTTGTLNQRSLGVGFLYKYKRWNAGADLLFTQDDFYDASIGLSYVPFNNAIISAGIAVKQLSYSVAFRMKRFRIAYIDDNGFMYNETRKSNLGSLTGRLYGGFIFDLN